MYEHVRYQTILDSKITQPSLIDFFTFSDRFIAYVQEKLKSRNLYILMLAVDDTDYFGRSPRSLLVLGWIALLKDYSAEH